MQRIAFSRIIFFFCEMKRKIMLLQNFGFLQFYSQSKGLPRNLHLSKIKILYSIIAYDVYYNIMVLHYYFIRLLLFKKEVNIAQERSNFVESFAVHFDFIKIDSTVINYRFHGLLQSSNKI